MLVRDILDIKGAAGGGRIYAIPPDSPLSEAIHGMATQAIGSVVIRRDGSLLGLLTLRELLAALDARGGCALALPVSAVMNPEPITGSPDDSIDDVRRVMTENHISHLPVMQGERLLDIVSLHDVAKAAYSQCSFENRLLKHYISHWPEESELQAGPA